nr:hypothetical protein [Ponticoccus alexandrii]
MCGGIFDLFRAPQVTMTWGLHERLWTVKYVNVRGLFGISLYSLELAGPSPEVDPSRPRSS